MHARLHPVTLWSLTLLFGLGCGDRHLFAVSLTMRDGGAPMADGQLPDAQPARDAAAVDAALDATIEPVLDGGVTTCDPACSLASEACVLGRCVDSAQSLTLAVANASTCALLASGQLSCWGRNSDGELGLGDIVSRTSPTSLGPRNDWIEVSAGVGQHFCGLAADRSTWCWGRNYAGALALGDLDSRTTPTRVGTDNDWARVVPDSGHTCWLRSDRTLWCAGRNEDGELGLGDTELRTTLEQVSDATSPFEVVSTGWGHTCGLSNAGTLWCWGRNAEGQLGTGDGEPRTRPTALRGRYVQVSARATHTCALREDDSLWCWGSNTDGQLGVGDSLPHDVPTRVEAPVRFRQISNGYFHTCAIASDDTLWCWGEYDFNTPGLANASDLLIPAQIGSDSDWQHVSAGYNHNCAVKRDQSVWCWGRNDVGQLGQGDTTTRLSPTRLNLP